MVYFPNTFSNVSPALVFILLFTVQCSQESTAPVELDIQYEETLTLGTDNDEAPNHEIFRSVTHVEIDERGWMYIVNAGESAIRVYDHDGDYKYSFGSQGAGPGEFQAISALLIDSKNRLLIVDPNQARVTAYSLGGDFLSSWELPSITRVHQIAEIDDGRFVLLGQHNDRLVHITDSEFSAIEVSFVRVEEMLTTNEREERVLLQFFPGKISILPNQSIAYVPALYKGELFIYSVEELGDWSLSEIIHGYTPHSEPATFTAFDQADRVDMPMTFPGEGRYAVQFHSISQYLYSNNDRLIHYSFQESDEGELVLRSEHFTIDGQLNGTTMIDKMETLSISILNLDNKNNLYLSDSRDFPTLRRLEIIE